MQERLRSSWNLCCKNRGSEKSKNTGDFILGAADVLINIYQGFE